MDTRLKFIGNRRSSLNQGICRRKENQNEHDHVPDRIWVTVASLTGPLDRMPDSHVRYEEHVKWFKFKDELPRYREKSDELIED